MSRTVTDFFENEYLDYASYDNFRSLPNYVDGQKPTARKAIYTFLEQNINDLKKVSTLQSKVSDFTNYLHGEGSIGGVIIGLGQNYVGSNNIPIFKKDGNFGSRLIPAPAATRYIQASKASYFSDFFHKLDNPILIEQSFEGDKIEPKFYVPTLPLLLINGAQNSMSVGHASHILPRNIEDVVDRIYKLLDNKEIDRFYPWFKGFKGVVTISETGSIETRGVFTKTGPKELIITELPIDISLAKYREILDKLEEKKIVQSWRDESDTKKDIFKFKVKLTKVIPDEELYDVLKIVKRESENFTCNDENNKIRIFEDERGILKAFVEIKLQYYQKRKDYIIKEIEHDTKVIKNRLLFLKEVISEKLIVFKKSRIEIEEQIEKAGIEKIDDSYEYLLSMRIETFTTEKMKSLVEQYKSKVEELNIIKEKDLKEWWKEDIKTLMASLKKAKMI